MEDEAEDLRRAVTLSDHEARIAALEKRLNELETQQRGRIPDSAYTQAINVQAKRLAHLETRHENLLRHTPEAREKPGVIEVIWDILWLPVAIVVVIYLFASAG